jgi:hypothetical protein
MPKFGATVSISSDEPSTRPAMDQIPAATKGSAASIPTDYNPSGSSSMRSAYQPPQLSESAQLAKIALEKEQWQAEQNKQNEDWMVKKWRPAMGWTYMAICILDMAIFPILWSVVQVMTSTALTQWNPLTLQGAGLFHLAMGAVLGIAAWSRGQEKITGKNI